ncbi:MAG TPA: lipid II flippase MurJ, partial [Sedimentisphaerales bacterium]|nr:lipid II flippase MurJ [Sedimentisphaerales bacterium]
GVVFSHISGLVDNMLASTLPTGQLSSLGYSKKIIDAILLIGPVALVTVVYSQLSHLSAEGKYDEFRTLFIRSLRLILFLSIPACVVLIMLKQPLVAALFERGRFTHQSTLGTSQVLFIYATGFVTFAIESLVVFGFYALSNTKVPVRVGIFAVLLDIIIAISLIGYFGVSAIAWAYVVSKTIKVLILLLAMDRKFRFSHDYAFINFILKVTASSLVAAICLYIIKGLNQDGSFSQEFIFNLSIPAAGFATIFLLCCSLFKIKEMNLLLAILLHRKILKSELSGGIS